MKHHKTEPLIREQERRKFFGRFAHRIPFQISEHTAQWLLIPRNHIKDRREGGFKRIKFMTTLCPLVFTVCGQCDGTHE